MNIGDKMLFLIGIMSVLITVIVFDIIELKKISLLKKLKNKKVQWIVVILPIIIILLLFNYVNAMIIFIHFAIFLLIYKLILLLVDRYFNKKFNIDLAIILSSATTLIYLCFGAYFAFHVYETTYNIKTDKDIQDFKIVFLTDSHVGTTFDGDGFYEHMKKISKIECDMFVVIGDFVDDDTKKEDMIRSVEALSLIKPKYGSYFIYGNHDKGYFNYRDFSNEDLRNELTKNNISILEDEILTFGNIYVIGRKDRQDKTRKSIQELVKDIPKDKYIISLNHQPNDYDNEMNNVDLVLSGHSHGGQMFPLAYFGKWTGANDEAYGLHTRESTNFIVSSGISDWRAIFKTGTIAEYVIINIKK